MDSHHFASPSPLPKKSKSTHRSARKAHTQAEWLPATRANDLKSRFFQNEIDLSDALKDFPPFCAFSEQFIAAMVELCHAKPILIQEHVSDSPWKVLVAVTLLNKTAGKKSIPIFFEIMDRWPNPETLAQAPLSLLVESLKDLGFGEKRSQRLVDISRTFLTDPPDPGCNRVSRGYTTALVLSGAGTESVSGPGEVRKVRYPPTPVSHVPGCGPYALDSYRIFCAEELEWKRVRPTDKELTKYLQWRWAVESYCKWDPTYGPGESIDLTYVCELTELLSRDSIEH